MITALLQLSSSSSILIAIALVIIIGYIGLAIFRRTRVPEVLILMLIGIIIARMGFVTFGTITTLRSFAPLFGSLALIVIMFNGSRRLKFDRQFMTGWKGSALGILDTLLSMVVLSALMHYAFGWPLIYGAILGAILGETTNIVVIPFIKRVKIESNIFDILFMETTINSVAAIFIFSILLAFSGSQVITAYSSASYLLDYVGIAVMIGLAAGFAWVFVMGSIKSSREYLATIAIALLIYGIVDVFNGAAIISVMIFGMVIGNEKIIAEPLKLNTRINKKGEMSVERELEFLITTFFFVFMGMIAVLSIQYLAYGIIITAVLVIARYLEGRAILKGNSPRDRKLFLALMPRGVAVATLASILYGIGGFYNSQIFYVSFMVIVLTSILSSLMLNRIKLDNV
ncbi:MAG: cation:proton antiporter [Candidatus Micrarchaeota archaeon]|nr:cation:proton antiporter [Candidatus Micrarchaeota archaeon]